MRLGAALRIGASFGAAVPFAPLSVGTPLVWYDLAHNTNAAGDVTALPDQSGNGHNATFTGGAEPTYTATNAGFNNLPTMNFPDAGTKRCSVPDLGLTTGAATFLIVCSSYDVTSNGYIMSSSNGAVEVFSGTAGGGVSGTNDAASTLVTGDAIASAAAVLVWVANGASSKLYVSKKTAVSGPAGSQNLTGLTLRLGHYGASVSGAGSWAQGGSTAHFMAFNGALSQADVEYLLTGFGVLAGVTIGA